MLAHKPLGVSDRIRGVVCCSGYRLPRMYGGVHCQLNLINHPIQIYLALSNGMRT